MPLSASVKPNVPKMRMPTSHGYCNVSQRVQGALNAMGEADWTWTAVDSNIKVDIQPLEAHEIKNIGVGTEVNATHRAFFLSTATFHATYLTGVAMRVEIDTTGDGSADTYYRVINSDDHASHFEALLEPTVDE